MNANMFASLLLLLFITLKLCGVIAWSWGWVLCPLWIPALLAVVVGILYWIYWLTLTEQQRNVIKLKRSLEAYADALKGGR